MIILGIDPGVATTGWGAIKALRSREKERQIKYLDHGVIETLPIQSVGQRLNEINNQLNKIIKKYQPQMLAVENVYFFKNLKTAMPVSQAKGVVLLTAAKKKIPVIEVTPLQVKMAIAGYGRAEKKQIQKMIKALLKIPEIPKPNDAADALGCAICCARLGILLSETRVLSQTRV